MLVRSKERKGKKRENEKRRVKEWTRGESVSGKAEGARKRGYEIMSVERRRQNGVYARAVAERAGWRTNTLEISLSTGC